MCNLFDQIVSVTRTRLEPQRPPPSVSAAHAVSVSTVVVPSALTAGIRGRSGFGISRGALQRAHVTSKSELCDRPLEPLKVTTERP
jgi:hypothetical protein